MLTNYPVITVEPTDLLCQTSLLRQKSKPVSELNIDTKKIVAEMIRALYSVKHGRGISAVQIGVLAQIFIVNINRIPGQEIIMIDPEIVSISGRLTKRSEGCMSLPDYKGNVVRRNNINIKGYNLIGEEIIITSHGYEANVIMHEIDHMNGVLYWDLMQNGLKPTKLDSEEFSK